MSDAYFGEIRMFAGNFAPLHWAYCHGQLLPVIGNEALYSLIGNSWGGDGINNFALPDLRGRIPVNCGQGPGLTPRVMGQRYGSETATLTLSQVPSHNHPIMASTDAGTASSPVGAVLARGATANDKPYGATSDPEKLRDFSGDAVASSGAGYPHDNLMPTLCLSFIICVQGLYPSRS